MPRHTHPRPINKHSRAYLRQQSERWSSKRYGAAKRRSHDSDWVIDDRKNRRGSSEQIDRLRCFLQQPGPLLFISAEDCLAVDDDLRQAFAPWPFNRSLGQFATTNPFTCCSCPLCAWSKREPRRFREACIWRREATRAAEEYLNCDDDLD